MGRRVERSARPAQRIKNLRCYYRRASQRHQDDQYLWRHILPNILPMIVITGAMDIGTMMMEIAGLSFLGFGAQPPTPEWGLMLNEGRQYIQTAPWRPCSFVISNPTIGAQAFRAARMTGDFDQFDAPVSEQIKTLADGSRAAFFKFKRLKSDSRPHSGSISDRISLGILKLVATDDYVSSPRELSEPMCLTCANRS